MKRLFCALLAVLVLMLSSCAGVTSASEPLLSAPPTIPSGDTTRPDRDLRFSVTQMLSESPMFRQLCDRFEAETGYRIDCTANPDSVAISVAETGKYDLLIVRKGSDSNRFVTAGYGTARIDWIRDAYVLVGPAEDPASVAEAETMTQAFIRIARSGATFVSCYDDSDLSRAEKDYWTQAGISIGNGRSWYVASHSSAGEALKIADEQHAYFLVNEEAYMQMRDALSLKLLLRGAAQTENIYCLIPISSETFEGVKSEGVDAFAEYVRSEPVRQWLSSYGTDSYGSPMFDIME